MSRIGKLPVTVPSGVEITLTGNHLAVKGSNGVLERDLAPAMQITVAENMITVARPSDASPHRSLHGLTRTLIDNMVTGVTKGFSRQLDLVGVGFRAAKQGNDLVLSVGYSHPIRYSPPDGIAINVPIPTQIVVSGASNELVGQVAAKIRSFRKPEPYKGKGVLYQGERLRRKAGKSGKAGKAK